MLLTIASFWNSDSARYRWSVASRTLAAVVGGYAHTALITAMLSLLLPLTGVISPAETVLATTMSSFLYYAVVIISVFHARSAARAWFWLLALSILPGIVLLITLPVSIA